MNFFLNLAFCLVCIYSGAPVYADVNMRHNHRLSLLLFNDLYQVLCYNVYQGAVNGERFDTFIFNDAIDYIGEYPNQHSVWSVDNISFHYSGAFQELLLAKGAVFFPFVAYDPKGNPTEYHFGNIKTKLPTKNANAANAAEIAESIVMCIEELPKTLRRSIIKKAKLDWILTLPE